MKTLTTNELKLVSGAGDDDKNNTPLETCNNLNLPDSTEITITDSLSGSLGVGGVIIGGTGTNIEISATTTCGALRDHAAQDGKKETSSK